MVFPGCMMHAILCSIQALGAGTLMLRRRTRNNNRKRTDSLVSAKKKYLEENATNSRSLETKSQLS
jgi:hypothetical protein